ncbi:MAG: glutamate--tRNA ligase [Janthinobacterium lividum]
MKVRLSPSPGALLHVGNARMALVAWLLARRHGGQVVLRLDDLDERTKPDQLDALQQDLAWLGLDWDAVIRQSEQQERYAAAIEKLKASGRLYPCFESEEELTSKREQRQRRNQATIYDRAMLKLTPEQRATAEAGGKRPYWRFLLSGVPTEWGDMVLGRQEVKLSAISDPVLVRADGMPMPLLTAVVDDIALGVTHAVHGEDHVTATGIQIDLRAALGVPTSLMRPGSLRFAHLPLLADPKGGKLKRTSALSLRSLRTDGIESTALAGLLAALGTPDAPAPQPASVIAASYDLSRVGKAQPRFDPQQLLVLNRRVLKGLPFEAVRERLPPAATPAFWQAVRGSLDLLREARGWWDVVGGSIVPPLVENEAEFLNQALELLPPEPWDQATWSGWTDALRNASGRKGRKLSVPLRLALTGEDQGPELQDLLPLMGRARVAGRLRLAAA